MNAGSSSRGPAFEKKKGLVVVVSVNPDKLNTMKVQRQHETTQPRGAGAESLHLQKEKAEWRQHVCRPGFELRT